MDFTGVIQNISKNLQTGQFNITFSVNEPSAISEVDAIKDCEKLSISAEKYRKKRSLDANAYCWVLCTKIAEKVDSSKDEVYEDMIQKYGYLYQDEDGYLPITVKSEVDMSKIAGHWKFIRTNGKFSSYLMIKGSSEYDTAEMAKFIDQIIGEAKNLGIETLPPAELERMKASWKA